MIRLTSINRTFLCLFFFLSLTLNAQVGIGTTAPAFDLDIAGDLNLNKGIASGVALRVNSNEALWFNGNFFSWGYGGNFNYFADRIAIGLGNTNPSNAYSLDALGAININNGNNNAVGLFINGAATIAKNGGRYTWGQGGTENYFSNRIGIGTNPNGAYSLNSSQGINVLNGIGTGNLLSTNGNVSITYDAAAQRYVWGSGGARNHFPDAVGIGAGTVNPTQTLDVGGNVRVRNLTEGTIVADGNGILSTSLYTKALRSQPNNVWNRVLVGYKSCIIQFAGKISGNGGQVLAFIVHYNLETNAFNVMSSSNCTVTNLGATAGNNGRLQVNNGGVLYTLTFVRNGREANINATGVGWIQGTIQTTAF